MAFNDSRTRAALRSLCARLFPDDGPQSNEKRREERRKDNPSSDRKTLQLCAQVRRALHTVIAAPGDARFDGVRIESVEPAPDATRLRVIVSVDAAATVDIPILRQLLANMTGHWRSEIAAQIHRKRVPTLTFDLIPRETSS